MPYAYLYFIDADGTAITRQTDARNLWNIQDGAVVGVTTITSGYGPYTRDTGLIYQGTDVYNNVFLSESGGTKFLLTNRALSDNAPLPTPYAQRSTETYVACFLAGTHLATASGPVAVERLAIGDLVLTPDGRAIPVKWVGRQSVASLFVADERAPICVEAGALGENLPSRDLKLTSDHALLLDGVLVQAGALVHGTTIRRMPKAETGDRYTVFHIETEGHEIILAEGCAAETFVDSVTRRRFDNYAEYEALFGGEAETILEMDLPRVLSARQLPPNLRDLIAIRRAA